MVAKVTINTSGLKKKMKKVEKELHKKALPRLARAIRNGVLSSFAKGKSPVKGQKRFQKYSENYRMQIKGLAHWDEVEGEYFVYRKNKKTGGSFPVTVKSKKIQQSDDMVKKRLSPVNLKVSGGLWKSLKIKILKRSLLIRFDSKLAVYHNEGVPKNNLPMRRMLPTGKKENFNRAIQNDLKRILKDVLTEIGRTSKGK